jgi:multiple sugar transport system substrate-binding protein
MLAGAAMAGCNWSPASSRQVEIRFWNLFTGPDGATMLKIVRQFNQENPDIHVIMQRIERGTYYNKLFVAGLGGRGPEVFIVHTDALARVSQANFVRTTDDMVGPGKIPAEDFDPNVWRAVYHNGHHYAIPLDIHLMGMYYNRRLLKQAKIPAPPKTRDEFLDALHRIKGLNGPDTWGFVYTWQRTNVYTCIRQNGGDIFTPDFSATTINSPAVVEALQFCCDLVSENLVPKPENTDSWVGFRQGNVGICWEGIYMLQDLQSQTDLDWGATPVPVLFKQPAAWCNSHNLCMRADLTDRKLEAAQRFVRYVSDHSLDWAAGGQIPVRRSLRNSARFATMYAQSQFAKEIPYAAYMPGVPFVFEYMDEYEFAIEKALLGSESPQVALDNAAKNITRIIERYRNPEASRQMFGRKLA